MVGGNRSCEYRRQSLVHALYLENGGIQVELQFKMKAIAKLLKMWIV